MTHFKRAMIALTAVTLLGTSALGAFAQDATAPAATTQQTVETPAANPGFLAGLRARFDRRDRGFGGGPNGAMMLKIMAEVDADKSGSVTQDEINVFRSAKVSAADVSKDGALNLDEFSVAYHELMRSRMVDAFQNLDDDGDGSITAAELDTRLNTIVATLDRNGDGVLSAADRKRPK